jgi:hypothetical protein
MQAQGTDKRGQGGAKATITSTLSQSGQGTRVDVLTDYHITGRLARFGRGGMIEDISNRLLRDFAACLQKSLARDGGGAAAAPAAAVGANGDGSAPAAAPAAGEATPAPTEAAEAETVVTASTGETPVSAPPDAGSGPPPHEHHHEHHHHEHHVADAINGIELVASVMWERTRRNPLPVAVVLGFLLALVTLRRRRG